MGFNLRQKILLHFIIFMIINCVIWLFSYYSNYTLNQKLRIIEKKNDLLNTILETRRYEKNFLLRNSKADLKEALNYIKETQKKQETIANNFQSQFDTNDSFQERSEDIRIYKKSIIELNDIYFNRETPFKDEKTLKRITELKAKVALIGRKLTTEIENVEKKERNNVFKLLNQSKRYILISLLSLFILTIVTAFFLALNVIKPLKLIEKSIGKIVRGDFTKIPSVKTGDEFESLTDSLNQMIIELDKRKNQLVQAEKMSSLGTLTSGVAHELNNPLNNISTSIQIVREELEEPEIEYKRNLLIEAEAQVDRARDIIRALLEFSRHSDFTIETVNIRKLIHNTMYLVAGEVPANIEVRINVETTLECQLDPRRIQQVLLNLIINSVHALEKDGGHIEIAAFTEPESSRFVLKVSDNGIGMSEEQLTKIFDPFYTTKDVGKGSGLGLSIIHGIIEQHGGRIEVNSSEGVGSTFTIFLPLTIQS